MTIRWVTAFVDRPAATFDAATRFWAAATGSTLSPVRGDHDEFATLVPSDGHAYLRVQRVADGPGGTHVDLHLDGVAAVAATAERAAALGATPGASSDTLVTLRSPAGLWLCLGVHGGESVRPRPVAVPGAASPVRTLVDQVCVDIAPDDHQREVEFWRDLTGWRLRRSWRPEFSYLERPDGMPLRLLLQRLDAAPPGPAGTTASAHLDLACDDVEAGAAAHERLGATVRARFERWVTLTDPAGLPYCLTRRHPDAGGRA